MLLKKKGCCIICKDMNILSLTVNKRVQNAVLGCNLKNDRMISVVSKANHSISQ